jgi:hypothetical protein
MCFNDWHDDDDDFRGYPYSYGEDLYDDDGVGSLVVFIILLACVIGGMIAMAVKG